MFGNIKIRRRTGHAASDQFKFVAPAAGSLTVTAADRTNLVHLAVAVDAGQAPWTLCALRVRHQPSTSRFQDSGCWFCASIAVSTGHTAADDKHGGLLRLREWLVNNPLREAQQTIERLLAP